MRSLFIGVAFSWELVFACSAKKNRGCFAFLFGEKRERSEKGDPSSIQEPFAPTIFSTGDMAMQSIVHLHGNHQDLF